MSKSEPREIDMLAAKKQRRDGMANGMAKVKRAKTLFKTERLAVLQRGKYQFVDRRGVTGVVVILAATVRSRLLLIEQFRPAVGKWVIELPAGLVGDEKRHETLAQAAHRELCEETGYAARKMVHLFNGPSSAGLISEVVSFFRAVDIKRVTESHGVDGERLIIHERPISSLQRWLRQKTKEGFLIDPRVYAGLFFL